MNSTDRSLVNAKSTEEAKKLAGDAGAELSDDEVENVTGGINMRPKQREMKPCTRCGQPIPSGKTPGYCDECLKEMHRQGIHPFV